MAQQGQHDQPVWTDKVQPYQMTAGKVIRGLDNIINGFNELDPQQQRDITQALQSACNDAKRRLQAEELPFQIISEATTFTQGKLQNVDNRDARHALGQVFTLALSALWTSQFTTPSGQQVQVQQVLATVDEVLMSIDQRYRLSQLAGARPAIHTGSGSHGDYR
jgi:hypothetical protein